MSIIAKYKFNSSIDTLFSEVNTGFVYTHTDIDNGDGTITRTIYSDNLPTSIRFENCEGLLEVLYLQGYPELKKYKSLCRDLKDFYFSRRYASDDYEILTHEEYIDYINNFYELLNKLKKIRSEFE